MKSPVDCPYVRDILPLSPDSRSPPLPLAAVAGASGHHLTSRLSHDDTMEAIEDDIEGEELELMEQLKHAEQQRQHQQVEPLSIAPPPAFSGDQQQTATTGAGSSLLADRSCTPAESIKEEDEDEEQSEDDGEQEEEEESSISVSQHGVIVSQEIPASKRRKSSTNAATSNGQLTPSKTSLGDRQSQELKNEASNVAAGDESSLSESADYGHELQRLSKESSADSGGATQEILEHLSKHHRELTLDEPSPTLEQSRSVDPQLRRESWRRESARKQTSTNTNTTITTSDEQVQSQRQSIGDSEHETRTTTGVVTSNTGTMKRKSKTNKATENSSREFATTPTTATTTPTTKMTNKSSGKESDAAGGIQGKSAEAGPEAEAEVEAEQQQREEATTSTTTTLTRGPPLAQTKPNVDGTSKQVSSLSQSQGGQQVVTRQSSVSLPTDTSICSSCSCLEEVCEDQQQQQQQQSIQQQQPVVVLARAQAAPCSSASSGATTTLASGPSGERAAWMSQEEGTVFTENYWLAHWLYISEHEESEIWRRAIDMNPPGGEAVNQELDQQRPQQTQHTFSSGETTASSTRVISQELIPGMPKEMIEISSTSSERSFSAKYKSTTRKMIHRRASIEMYKRIMNNNLKREKRVEISRSNGEFGFRIHGSRPVVVSAIERGTSAETCGLQVGDLIYAINGTNILDMAHSDVVKLAHSGKYFKRRDLDSRFVELYSLVLPTNH